MLSALLALVLLVLAVLALLSFLDWRRRRRLKRRAGCVPLRVEPGGRLSILLIQGRKKPEWWTFPAGTIERGEKVGDAALRETCEEAGVVGSLGRLIAQVEDEKSLTSMFALHVEAELEKWAESAERKRQWFDLGAPGAPSASKSFAAVRAVLAQKVTQHRVLDACERLHGELQRQSELREKQWGRPPQSQRPSHRPRKAVDNGHAKLPAPTVRLPDGTS